MPRRPLFFDPCDHPPQLRLATQLLMQQPKMNFEEAISSAAVQELVSQQIKLLEHLRRDISEYTHLITNEAELSRLLPPIKLLLSEANGSLENKASLLRVVCKRQATARTFIHRLPNELLQNTLSLVIFARGAHGRLPLTLMCVCRLWHSLLPEIRWPRFTISLSWSPKAIEDAWWFLSRRLKHVPRRIVIDKVDSKRDEVFKLLKLNRLPQPLDTLEVRLISSRLSSDAREAIGCRCSKFIYIDDGGPGEKDQGDNLDLKSLLRTFRGVTDLSVTTTRPKFARQDPWLSERKAPRMRFPGIDSLSITMDNSISMNDLVEDLPDLKVLALVRTSVYLGHEYDRTLYAGSLTTLKIYDAEASCMVGLQAPNLVYLALEEVHYLHANEVKDFLAGTPSLKTLDIYYTDKYDKGDTDYMAKFSPCCPNLDTLALNQPLETLSPQHFPNIKTLDLRYSTRFRGKKLESFVRARCLPRTHPLSTMDPSLALVPLELIFSLEDRSNIDEAFREFECFQGVFLEKQNWVDPFGVQETGLVMRWT